MTKAKIVDLLLRGVLLVVGIGLFFWWFDNQVEKRVKAECELKQAKQGVLVQEAKQKEVKDVANKTAVIHSRPNLKRDGLLASMRNGEL